MIRYNFDRMFKARGIERPFTFLRKAGFSDNFATKIKKNNVKRLELKELEKLCLILKCTPNDFFEWTPDKDIQIDENHAINIIRKSDKVVDLTKTLNSVPLGKLKEIETLINEKLNTKAKNEA